MKKIVALTLAWLVISAVALGQEKQLVVRVKNPLKLDRPGEIVVVHWKDIKAVLPSIDPSKITVQEKATNTDVVYQLTDLNKDGVPDEMLFQSSFKPSETKEFVVRQSATQHVQFHALTDARFVPPREDVAWENNRIAFRMYGPPLAKEGSNNGIDVWTKRVRSLIVEKWYEGEEQKPPISYHEDHGEGADYFDVGKSLGAGASALVVNGSLLQPGVFQKYNIIAAGPLQAIFELTYDPVLYNGKKITEVLRIALNAGVNLNKISITFSSESAKGSVTFAAGIVKRNGTETTADKKNGWISLWGLTRDKAEIGSLGTGIVMPTAIIKEMKEDTVHAMIVGKAELGKAFTYYAGAGWTLSGDFKSKEDWNKYLADYAMKVRSPLVVSLARK